MVSRLKQGWVRLRLLWVTAYYALLTAFMTFPLVLRLGNSVIGTPGDNIYFVWLVRWYQQVIFEGRGRLFFNAWMNYPEGWNLSTTDTTLASALPGTFFSLLWGPVAGYNLAMLLTFVLAGLAMYIWVRHLTHSEGAALLAGTVYAFLPAHMAHFLVGHLNLSGIQWFPLYFMGLYDLLRGGEKRWWLPALLAAVSLGLIGFTSMYYLYMTLLISAVFAALYLVIFGRRRLAQAAFWKPAGLFALLAVPLMFASLRPFLQLSGQGTLASRPAEYASMYSASPTDYLLPSNDHFLWGAWVGTHFDRSLWIEGSFYVGVLALALVIAAVVWHRQERGLLVAGLLTALVAAVLGLGLTLHWNNQELTWHVPVFLQGVLGRSETPVYLPAYLLFEKLPFYAKMRAVMRIGFFALIFTSAIAGLGVSELLRRVRPARRAWLAAGLIVIALFDFYPGPYTQFTQVQHRPVDDWLAAQPGQGAVVQFPFKQSEDQQQVYYSLFHKKPFVGGFFNANQPPQYQYIAPVLDGFPNEESLPLLRDLGVEYLLVDKAAYDDFEAVDERIRALGFMERADLDGQRVYEFAEP